MVFTIWRGRIFPVNQSAWFCNYACKKFSRGPACKLTMVGPWPWSIICSNCQPLANQRRRTCGEENGWKRASPKQAGTESRIHGRGGKYRIRFRQGMTGAAKPGTPDFELEETLKNARPRQEGIKPPKSEESSSGFHNHCRALQRHLRFGLHPGQDSRAQARRLLLVRLQACLPWS